MTWNWQKSDWPHFRWDKTALEELEARFLHQSGILLGTLKHMNDEQKQGLTIELISTEAMMNQCRLFQVPCMSRKSILKHPLLHR